MVDLRLCDTTGRCAELDKGGVVPRRAGLVVASTWMRLSVGCTTAAQHVCRVQKPWGLRLPQEQKGKKRVLLFADRA